MSDEKPSLRILYGVSTDGNGHIASARALIPALEERGAEVTTLFSGTPSKTPVDESVFKDAVYRRGYERSVDSGHVSVFKTVAQNLVSAPRLFHEVMTMNLTDFDLVVSDFEPISAMSRRIQNILSGEHVPTLGIAHQYAFEHDVPKGNSFLMNNAHSLVRAKTRIGMHFHHFNQPNILPPILAPDQFNQDVSLRDKSKILVYLGFEDDKDVLDTLKLFENYSFDVFSKHVSEAKSYGHVTFYPISRDVFRDAFIRCDGVIANAGFMLSSESLHAGKKLLLKPMDGHPEQESNVVSLQELGGVHSMEHLDVVAIKRFLEDDRAIQIKYPEVVEPLADWIMEGNYSKKDSEIFCETLWDDVKVSDSFSL